MSLVLYYAPWSSATTSLWALEELGVPFEKVKVDLKAKGTHTPAFLKLNPNGRVPVLVHDGTPIFESIAIIAHLGETFGVEKKLYPAPGLVRAQALQWLAWANVSLGAAVNRFMANTSDHAPASMHNAEAAEAGKAEAERLLGILDDHLAGKPWMVGDGFTLVDAHLAGAAGWIGQIGFDLSKRSSIQAWIKRCQARPAFAAIMAP